MLHLLRRLVLAGGAVAVLGLAAVGAGAIGRSADSSATPATSDVATAADALLAADTTTAAATPDRLTVRQLRHLAAWRHLVHATATLDLPALGGLTTVQLDHGTIQAVSATSLTISETGGGTVTVSLGARTKVRTDGARSTVGALKAGDEVFTMSRVESGGTEAYLVVVPKS